MVFFAELMELKPRLNDLTNFREVIGEVEGNLSKGRRIGYAWGDKEKIYGAVIPTYSSFEVYLTPKFNNFDEVYSVENIWSTTIYPERYGTIPALNRVARKIDGDALAVLNDSRHREYYLLRRTGGKWKGTKAKKFRGEEFINSIL